jgi:hypothetical protein
MLGNFCANNIELPNAVPLQPQGAFHRTFSYSTARCGGYRWACPLICLLGSIIEANWA